MQISGNAFQFAQLGIRRGMSQLSEAASTIAQNSAKPAATTAALVSLIESRQQVESSVRVLKRANRAFDSLLDIKA